jgi:hypothetical protein
VLASYMYGDPAEALDRKRAEDAARQKRAERPKRGARQTRTELSEEDLKYVPREWLADVR